MSAHLHDGRPINPVHAERGAALMAQWAVEDGEPTVIDLRAEVDQLGDYLEAVSDA